jgi:anti-sigma regulatory factor (Ser/Thr protein kinase)
MGMHSLKQKRADVAASQVVCGSYSKKEAAELIARGTRHIHSSPHLDKDICAAITRDSLQKKIVLPYPWENQPGIIEMSLTKSAQRQDTIRDIISRLGVGGKRDLKEKLESLLEELITNSIYHAYQNPDGSSRYARRDSIVLPEAEKIRLSFIATKEGLHLKVSDQGGSFKFNEAAQSFARCYGGSHQQIQNKEGGAGLGLYMSYEVCTHLKIVSVPGRETSVSCWLADKSAFDPKVFSFNFFEWR